MKKRQTVTCFVKENSLRKWEGPEIDYGDDVPQSYMENKIFLSIQITRPSCDSSWLLQRACESVIWPLTRIARPRTCRESRVVFIPKGDRASYTLSKDFHPISLTSFNLKTIKRLVDRDIQNRPLLKKKTYRKSACVSDGTIHGDGPKYSAVSSVSPDENWGLS